MKGRNSIEINHLTMLEAVQLWLNAAFKKPPDVVDVSWMLRGAGDKTFILTVKEKEKGNGTTHKV